MKRLFRKIKRFFTRDYSQPSRDYPSHGSDNDGNPSFRPNWGFVVPHTKDKPGACGYKPTGKKVSEYYYALEMLNLTRFLFETRDNGGVYGAAKRLKNQGITASFEPHKNAFNKKAHGFEILVIKGDSLSGHYARLLCDAFADKYPERRLRHDNGIKWVKKGDRGYYNLVQAKKAGMEVALLGESFFIDNPKEWISPEDMAQFWTETLV